MKLITTNFELKELKKRRKNDIIGYCICKIVCDSVCAMWLYCDSGIIVNFSYAYASDSIFVVIHSPTPIGVVEQ